MQSAADAEQADQPMPEVLPTEMRRVASATVELAPASQRDLNDVLALDDFREPQRGDAQIFSPESQNQ